VAKWSEARGRQAETIQSFVDDDDEYDNDNACIGGF
jgi:hypothetical protein